MSLIVTGVDQIKGVLQKETYQRFPSVIRTQKDAMPGITAHVCAECILLFRVLPHSETSAPRSEGEIGPAGRSEVGTEPYVQNAFCCSGYMVNILQAGGETPRHNEACLSVGGDPPSRSCRHRLLSLESAPVLPCAASVLRRV